VPDPALAEQLDDETLSRLSLLWWHPAACAEMTVAPREAVLATLSADSVLRRAPLETQDAGLLFAGVWMPDTGHTGYHLWTMVGHLRRERASEGLQQELIESDAPFEMMQTFFGLSSRGYSRLCRFLAAAPAVGCPREADEVTQHTLWATGTRRRKDTDADLLAPEVYLDLHRETGIGLRVIWTLTRRWTAFGDLTDAGAHASDGR